MYKANRTERIKKGATAPPVAPKGKHHWRKTLLIANTFIIANQERRSQMLIALTIVAMIIENEILSMIFAVIWMAKLVVWLFKKMEEGRII